MSGVAVPGSPPTLVPECNYQDYEPVCACPLCSSPRRSVIDPEADVVRCQHCGHRFVDPRPTQSEISRGYSLPGAYDSWLADEDSRAAMWERRYRRTLAHLPPGRLLDIGAGIGTFLAIAQMASWDVDGIEVSRTAAIHARDLYGLSFRIGTLEEAEPVGPYDVITLWHVLEHLPEPGATLRNVASLLRPGGWVILAMPNDGAASWLLTAIGNHLRVATGRPRSLRYVRLRPGVESHIQHFDTRTIARLLRASGFAVERIAVDDASPGRSHRAAVVFTMRKVLSKITPWNFGREMLVIARVVP